jgi:hypothetical protein
MGTQRPLYLEKTRRFDAWIVGVPPEDKTEHLLFHGIFLTQESAQIEADALSEEIGSPGFYKIEMVPVYR